MLQDQDKPYTHVSLSYFKPCIPLATEILFTGAFMYICVYINLTHFPLIHWTKYFFQVRELQRQSHKTSERFPIPEWGRCPSLILCKSPKQFRSRAKHCTRFDVSDSRDRPRDCTVTKS